MNQKVVENYLLLKDHIASILQRIGRKEEEVTLIAVTKNQPLENVLPLFREGVRNFGENRVLDALPKIRAIPAHWHLIGTLQTNKIKLIKPFTLIHSLDRLELAKKLSKWAYLEKETIKVLMEVNLSGEENKHGPKEEEFEDLFSQIKELPNLKILGLMTMAPYTTDPKPIRKAFSTLRKLKETYLPEEAFLSMGMSNDYEIALEEGATHLRIGSKIFHVLS